MTTQARKFICLPPLVTRVTRAKSTICWSNSGFSFLNLGFPLPLPFPGNIVISNKMIGCLKSESAVARAFRERFHAAVILVSGAVEHNGRDTGGFGFFGKRKPEQIRLGGFSFAFSGITGTGGGLAVRGNNHPSSDA